MYRLHATIQIFGFYPYVNTTTGAGQMMPACLPPRDAHHLTAAPAARGPLPQGERAADGQHRPDPDVRGLRPHRGSTSSRCASTWSGASGSSSPPWPPAARCRCTTTPAPLRCGRSRAAGCTTSTPTSRRSAGSYLYEPGGSVHTFYCPEDNTEDTVALAVDRGRAGQLQRGRQLPLGHGRRRPEVPHRDGDGGAGHGTGPLRPPRRRRR